jgi:hypothetical protein
MITIQEYLNPPPDFSGIRVVRSLVFCLVFNWFYGRPFSFGHCFVCTFFDLRKGPGVSMSQVVGLPNNSYKPITNTAWVRAWLCKLQKGCTRLTPARDKVGRWFSQGTPAFSTTITGRYDIAEILQKVALNPINNQSIYGIYLPLWYLQRKCKSQNWSFFFYFSGMV